MLVLSRKIDEKIVIERVNGEIITITMVRVGKQPRIGIKTDKALYAIRKKG